MRGGPVETRSDGAGGTATCRTRIRPGRSRAAFERIIRTSDRPTAGNCIGCLNVSAISTNPEPRAPRYHSLDHWRGVACLMIVAFHACVYLSGGEDTLAPQNAARLQSDGTSLVARL